MEMAQYLHAYLFLSCVKSLQHAIYKGHLLSWPIENQNIDKLTKTTIATQKGHLDQERKYLNTTTMPKYQFSEYFPEKI